MNVTIQKRLCKENTDTELVLLEVTDQLQKSASSGTGSVKN